MKRMILSGILVISFASQAASTATLDKNINEYHRATLNSGQEGGISDSVVSGSGISDSLIKYFASAGASFAGSKIMNAFGIQSTSQKELADLGTLVSDMNIVLDDLRTIKSQLNTLLGDFNVLYQQVLSDQTTLYGSYITLLQNGVGTYWSAFQNNMPDNVTLQTVAGTPVLVRALQAEFNNAAINALYNNLINMTDTQSSGFYAIMIRALKQKINAQVIEINYGAGDGDIVPSIDGYNESLMNLYQSTMVSVQQSYVIFSTVAYLMANTSEFSTITLPIPGVRSSNSYSTNQTVINKYYQNLIFGEVPGSIGIFASTVSAIYSDQFSNQGYALVDLPSVTGVTQIRLPLPLPSVIQAFCNATPKACQTFASVFSKDYQPVPANMIRGMPLGYQGGSNAQAWTSRCNLYVWQGVVPAQGIPWQGATVVPTCTQDKSGATQCSTSLGGGRMTAWCNGKGTYQPYTMEVSQAASVSGPWSFYYGPYANQSSYLGKFQPQNYSVPWLFNNFYQTNWNGNYGYAKTKLFSGSNIHNCAYIGNNGFNNPPGLYRLTDSNPSHDGCNSYGIYNVATARLPGGTFWSHWQYVSTDGLTTPIWIAGQLHSFGKSYEYLFQVQCHSSDPFCYQPVAGPDWNGVCVGGHRIALFGSNTDHVTATYSDGCGNSVGRAGPDAHG